MPNNNFRKRVEILEQERTAPVTEKYYKCSECTKSFTYFKLKLHMKDHSKVKPFSCVVPGSSEMRSKPIEKPYSCPECSKSYRKSKELIQHMNVHTGDKPYSCPECSKLFTCSRYLKEHMRVHTEENSCLE